MKNCHFFVKYDFGKIQNCIGFQNLSYFRWLQKTIGFNKLRRTRQKTLLQNLLWTKIWSQRSGIWHWCRYLVHGFWSSKWRSFNNVSPFTRCLKIAEKVSFYNASEASYAYILSGQKWPISAIFWKSTACGDQTWQKFAKNAKIQMRHF